MASADEYAAWIVKNADKKGTPDFETVARAYQDAKSAASKPSGPSAEDIAMADPTNGMGVIGKAVAGYGAAIPNMVRGVGQRIGSAIDSFAPPQKTLSSIITGQAPRTLSSKLGLPQQSDIDEAKRLDAPLMNSGAGMVGNVLGNIAAAVPAAFIPGVNSVAGGAALGAGLGYIQPTATGDSSKVLGVDVKSPALANALTGGALGGGSVAAGNVLGAGYRAIRAAAEPFTAAGPQRIAGRTIARFAEDPSRIANVTNAPTITGALPTLAEQTGDVGLARLQDSLRSVDPQINNALATRASENNAARVNALRQMAGGDGARDFAVAERAGTAGPMYQEAFNVVPDAAGMTPAQARTMQTLQRSPAVQSAMRDARAIAANSGTNVGPANATGSIEGLHNMKMALDDAIQNATNSGQTNLATSIRSAQQRLTGLMEELSPEYANARGVYAQMSRPVNQMDVAAQLARKGLSNGSDLSGNPTINRNALLGAMRDEPALVRQATGRNLGGLADVMAPDQMNMLSAIRNEVDRAGAVATAGNGPGSATAQRLASQNILRQAINPDGPGGGLAQRAGAAIAEHTLSNTLVGKATNWLYSGIAEPRIQQALLRATLQPEEAQAALAAARQQGIQLPNNLLTQLAGQARRVTGVSTANTSRQP